jgi:phosphoribosylamine--glycine ligase
MICRSLPADVLSPDALLDLARRERIDLTVVGPEAPLETGLANRFRAAGRLILGPDQAGAALECSKVFAKRFMAEHGIPTARFAVANTAAEALAHVDGGQFGLPIVLKADGLAAGKGVVIAETIEEAKTAIESMMVDRAFGASGARVVIEECLTGPEVSAFYLCDGVGAASLWSAQDHKRIGDGDRGPNTGGMGAFAPSPLFTPSLAQITADQIVTPVLAGMRQAGSPYIGFLYVSLMLTPDGPKVIEFNVRFGDPEAQVVLPGLEGSLGEALAAAAGGRLDESGLTWSSDRFVGVVIASRGYPGPIDTGFPIDGLTEAASVPGALVFHAGTASRDGQIVTAGGRVLTVVGRGTTFEAAMATAYEAAGKIRFEGMQMRRDIGLKAL